jgi:Family of unknown function (DUF6114)/zinc-ribbon domain
MSSPSYAPMYPSTAYWLSLIGGILILLYGFAEIAEAILFSSVLESIVPGATALVISLGALAVVFGLGIILLGFRLKSRPASARTSGVIILVLSLVSIIGGGGFFIGLILALIGGILAITWRPPEPSPPMYGRPAYGSPIPPASATTPWASPPSPPLQPGVAQRFCSSCGSPNVASAQFCAKCGAPMS